MCKFKIVNGDYVDDEGGATEFFGIQAFSSSSGDELFNLPDISSDRRSIEKLVNVLSENGVQPCHFLDVIEDMFWL